MKLTPIQKLAQLVTAEFRANDAYQEALHNPEVRVEHILDASKDATQLFLANGEPIKVGGRKLTVRKALFPSYPTRIVVAQDKIIAARQDDPRAYRDPRDNEVIAPYLTGLKILGTLDNKIRRATRGIKNDQELRYNPRYDRQAVDASIGVHNATLTQSQLLMDGITELLIGEDWLDAGIWYNMRPEGIPYIKSAKTALAHQGAISQAISDENKDLKARIRQLEKQLYSRK